MEFGEITILDIVTGLMSLCSIIVCTDVLISQRRSEQ